MAVETMSRAIRVFFSTVTSIAITILIIMACATTIGIITTMVTSSKTLSLFATEGSLLERF